jgi:hypothetical protein
LKILFHNLYQIVVQPDIDVSQAYTDGQWNIQFRRQLHEVLIEEWDQLQDMLSEVTLGDGRDIVYWALEQSKKYSTGSLYMFITSGGVRDQQIMNVWKCNIPLKVKIFIWMASHNRIQSGVQLRRNNGRVLKNVLLVMFWKQQIIYSFSAQLLCTSGPF